MVIKGYEAGDILKIELRAYEKHLSEVDQGYLERMDLLALSNAKSIYSNGEILTVVGLAECWTGVAEVWQVPSNKIKEVQFEYSKTIKYLIDEVLKGNEFRRLQTTCINDDMHNRWLKFLGFEKEGIMKQFGPTGLDYAIYGRVTNG